MIEEEKEMKETNMTEKKREYEITYTKDSHLKKTFT